MQRFSNLKAAFGAPRQNIDHPYKLQFRVKVCSISVFPDDAAFVYVSYYLSSKPVFGVSKATPLTNTEGLVFEDGTEDIWHVKKQHDKEDEASAAKELKFRHCPAFFRYRNAKKHLVDNPETSVLGFMFQPPEFHQFASDSLLARLFLTRK